MQSLRSLRCLALVAGVWLCLGPATARAATDEQIQSAINRAVGYLKSSVTSQRGGHLSLMVLALLKAGVPADSPEVRAGLAAMAAQVNNGVFTPVDHHRYEAGVALMAFGTADPVAYKPQIEAIARYLIEAQEPHGGWHYPAGTGGGTLPGGGNAGDTSITQYAMLGLWEASRHGVNVPKRVWDNAAAWHMKTQLRDGGFCYQPNPFVANPQLTHSMTTAGTASMLLARLMLYPEAKELPTEEISEEPAADKAAQATKKRKAGIKYGILLPVVADTPEAEEQAAEEAKQRAAEESGYKGTAKLNNLNNSILRGLRWLTADYRVDTTNTVSNQWNCYYLYGLERLAALAGVAEIGGHDWYADGANFWVSRQAADGGWNIDSAGVAADTAFGLMFLVKATAKTLKTTPKKRRDPKLAGGVLVGARGLPDDLSKLQTGAQVKPRKVKGAVDQLLGELEKLDGSELEAFQEAIVDTILTEDPEALVGQKARLQQLSRDRKVEIRRTAVWALGRTNDLSVVPDLLARLEDVELSVIVEARNALRFMTRKTDFLELPESPSPDELATLSKQARDWWLQVRPYTERDDLQEATESKP